MSCSFAVVGIDHAAYWWRRPDPFSALDGMMDSDWDGLLNFEEALAGTKPTWTDSDLDGVDDYFETVQGSDPNSATDGGRVPSGADFVGLNP